MTGTASVAVVLTAHREGLLAVPTLRSLDRALQVAAAANISVEVLISLDKADKLTRDICTSWKYPKVKILDFEFGDPARCRNQCIREAQSEFISILDADDLIGADWIAQATSSSRVERRKVIWHPEVNIVFGEESHIYCHPDMDDPEFDELLMVAYNPWTSLCFAPVDAFLAVPYPACDFQNGIGHEDWAWNRRVVEIGYMHKIVKGTGHAIRRKAISVVKQASASRVIPAPTSLFRLQLSRRFEDEQRRGVLRPTF